MLSLSSIRRDLRYALRGLRRQPGFAAIAVTTLAVGIGATSAIFSIVDGVVIKPLSYEGSERLVALGMNSGDDRFRLAGISVPNFEDWKARTTTLEVSQLPFLLEYQICAESFF